MKQYKHLTEDQREALIIGTNLLLDLTGTVSEIQNKRVIAHVNILRNNIYFSIDVDDYEETYFFIQNILDKDPQDVQAEADAIRAELDKFVAEYYATEKKRNAKKIAELEKALAILKGDK